MCFNVLFVLQIFVDGHDLKSLQLDWWRSQVALVSQEPALFNDSIFANIAMAKPGEKFEYAFIHFKK